MTLEAMKASPIALFRNVSPSKEHWLNTGSGITGCPYTRPCCTIPKQDSSLSGADFAQLTCCRTGIPNPVILLIAFTHASASPTCAL